MEIDSNTLMGIIIGLLGLVMTLSGFIFKHVYSQLNVNRKDIDNIRVHLAGNYAKKDDIKELRTEIKDLEKKIFDHFRIVEDKLDNISSHLPRANP